MITERPKARIVKVGSETAHPFTTFIGFHFDGTGIEGVAGMEYDDQGELQFVAGYTPDELREVIARETL